MEEAGIFDAYQNYAGSYVSTSDWINYVVDALTIPRESLDDICKPVYDVWKKAGAEAAVERYRYLLKTDEDQYDFSDYVLMSIGSKLYANDHYKDAIVFLMGSLETYPESKYAYHTHYLVAKGLQKLGRIEEVIECLNDLYLSFCRLDRACLFYPYSATSHVFTVEVFHGRSGFTRSGHLYKSKALRSTSCFVGHQGA
jgi:tetratricopeptide (TPR) repeat protein